jgi:hypothetical protein
MNEGALPPMAFKPESDAQVLRSVYIPGSLNVGYRNETVGLNETQKIPNGTVIEVGKYYVDNGRMAWVDASLQRYALADPTPADIDSLQKAGYTSSSAVYVPKNWS